MNHIYVYLYERCDLKIFIFILLDEQFVQNSHRFFDFLSRQVIEVDQVGNVDLKTFSKYPFNFVFLFVGRHIELPVDLHWQKLPLLHFFANRLHGTTPLWRKRMCWIFVLPKNLPSKCIFQHHIFTNKVSRFVWRLFGSLVGVHWQHDGFSSKPGKFFPSNPKKEIPASKEGQINVSNHR